MPEGEGREDKEDLFEDLDKFFAPIQDVEWPEPVAEEGEAPAPPPQAPPEPEPEPVPPADLGAADTGILGEPFRAEEEPEQEGLFTAPPGEEPEEEWTGEEETEPSTYETEEDISLESFRAAPTAYEGLPGPAERAAEEAAEEAEAPEEEPSPEAVEAAAEHFAEAIREEVETEPEPEEVVSVGPEEVEEQLLAELEERAPEPRTVVVGEGLGGPSWQEPTSMEVGPEHERRPAGRDMPAAFLTGLVLAAVAAGSIAIGAAYFAVVAGLIVLLAQGELYGVMHKRHHQPAAALGLASGGLILGAAYFRGESAMLAIVGLSVFATFLWFMATPAAHRKHTLENIGLTLLGIVYVPLLAGYALATLKGFEFHNGRGLTLAIIGLTFAYDTAAFVVGYFWGSRPLAPTVSPKKSWEGAVGATLVVIALSVGIVGSAKLAGISDSVANTVGLAVVVAIFAPLGDLAESLLKRDLGVKDMGSILPGHGGVLDRIDSVLFVAPVAFLFLRFVLL